MPGAASELAWLCQPVLHKKQAQVIGCARVGLPTGAQGPGTHSELEDKMDGDSSRVPTAVPVSPLHSSVTGLMKCCTGKVMHFLKDLSLFSMFFWSFVFILVLIGGFSVCLFFFCIFGGFCMC